MNSTNNKWFNWGIFITLLVNTIVGVAGWYFVNRYNVSRDIENKKRELTTEYLIKAYRAIATFAGSSHPVINNELLIASNEEIKRINDLEQAIADIQLFGNNYQREEIARICENAVKFNFPTGGFDWKTENLLLNLRKELRKELKLKEISSEEDKKGIQWLRINKKIEEAKKLNKFSEKFQTTKEK